MARIARNRLFIPLERNRDILITVTLEWEAADSDGDTLTYTLYIDTDDGRQEATEDNTGLTTNTKEVVVESGTIYYWSVTTSDGSISVTSDVFSFRVD